MKLWFVLRAYGIAGLQHHIRQHLELAREFAGRVEADPRLELVAPVPFGLVCFRHVGGSGATDALAEAINATNRVAVTPSRLDGQSYIRVSIGQTRTEQRHVDQLWALIVAALDDSCS